MKVLAIDTSNQTMSIALISDQKVIAEITTNVSKNHSVRLMPSIHGMLNEANVVPQDLDKIVVAIGPGSYTGVRIGVTTAKTLAWSLNIPVSTVSSLELVAYNGLYFNGLVCPFFDARRGQVYTGLYKSNGESLQLVWEEANLLFVDWLKQLAEQEEYILFISNDLELHKESIKEILGEKAIFAPAYLALPKASVLGIVGGERMEIANIHELVPNYMRLVEAETKWLEEQRKNSNE
ncbi:tRNA (adenosine(37)-N6)-threonylcarbamoyltransferase complex dimerization subunit type 1 TsaB [Salirhabdus sp. Marseille-P4669]|uniref:tRNA (adenosine(37)-N6)-threonylcarbamoyltransferase complex dimerization subunit type 1 TsaB n=1 Tax=Salirhabdus sp. Marseille-P4669 TaxID=2042310 RepID=UPI000C7E0D26|nr:tRNA (adenosine(37)-N6)-threonylcarbamoyltransferase complex dimerization subunit type 1 TsaB [Salirhabdus sp. Marseille-P4669]